MRNTDILRLRLTNQQLVRTKFTKPEDVISWFGAVQSQDYAGAKWAVGMRTQNATDQTLEKAFNDGKILRTHIMRPTWHFVHPSDIRWLLKLTETRVKATVAYYDRQLELDADLIKQTNKIIEKALTEEFLTRVEVVAELKRQKILGDGRRMGHIIHHAEIDGIICSGPRRGKQFTYALLEKRAPKVKELHNDEALCELVKRYFQSHGPATIRDFVWWSGLSTTEIKKGIAMFGRKLSKELIDGKEYYFYSSNTLPLNSSAYLLPFYDEYTVAYADRMNIIAPTFAKQVNAGGGMLNPVIVIAGRVVGIWKRTLKKNEVVVNLSPFSTLDKAELKSVIKAADLYGKFLGVQTTVT